MDLRLKGKVAMVGGASRGLGYAVAEALATEGASVSMASSNDSSIREAARKISVHGHACARHGRGRPEGASRSRTGGGRPSSGSAASTCCSRTPAALRPARLLSFDDAAWQNAIDLLLFSTLRMVRAVVPSMRQRGGGAILVSTSSSVKEPIANLGLSTVRARVGLGAGQDARASSSPATHSRQPDHSRAHRHGPRSPAR